ncbi:M48 family metalloprotease [Flavobacteriaceae bacterium]|nr:M48 family metalloprotease [Flavobacteriaceae bacterium]
MKRTVLCFLIFFYSQAFSQTKDELDLCMAIQANSFTSNTEAENALDRILDVIGASKNFVLTPCDKISNAVATAYKGTRYILYDREFMNLISKNTNDWSNLFIFAHEVGHHINGHSIDLLLYTNDVVDAPSLEKSRQQELEADEFAAFVLAKLGANLSQLNNVITLISDNSDDTYSTHPKRSKRLESIEEGYDKGNVEVNLSSPEKSYDILGYNLSKEQITFGNWFRIESKDPFSKLLFGTLLPGRIHSNLDLEKLIAPHFSISHIRDEKDNIWIGMDLEEYPISFVGLKDWVNIEEVNRRGKLKREIIPYKLTVEIIIFDSYLDEIARHKGEILSSFYQDEFNSLSEFYETNDISILKNNYSYYAFERKNYKDGDKMIVKFTPIYSNGKKNEILSETYFEYSLSGSSEALKP